MYGGDVIVEKRAEALGKDGPAGCVAACYKGPPVRGVEADHLFDEGLVGPMNEMNEKKLEREEYTPRHPRP